MRPEVFRGRSRLGGGFVKMADDRTGGSYDAEHYQQNQSRTVYGKVRAARRRVVVQRLRHSSDSTLCTPLTPGRAPLYAPAMTKKKPAKKPPARKRPPRPDVAQNALASVEKLIGGKLAEGMGKGK